MSSDTDRDLLPGGRTIGVLVYGDTAEEIELAALDEARAFFGSDIQLRVVRDYGVMPSSGPSKKYMASVRVETVGYPS
jgi:hypothetical protein